ncbi:FecR family protein [Sphingobacterium yanglingense]|uniref:FecR family protein n=1 Tax=Sphingobacterium yanglingense TaxID=1437280 RepID=A0A4R6WEA5_9SPHI|nr:FecR domain-containing protein [Sphingobacterium yanglingense]TDQ78122.1 FecR family protein [Sphingobacterium yanglingense]
MEHKDVIALLHKYRSGTCSETERALLESWYLYHDSDAIKDLSPEELSVDLLMIREGLPLVKATPVLKLWRPKTWAVAAAAITVITLGVLLYKVSSSHVDLQLVDQEDNELLFDDVAPGKKSATITLANGRTIELSDSKGGLVVGDQLKYDDNTAVEEGTLRDLAGQELTMLVARTPKGGTYAFVLPDGTRIWLNADSYVSFPSSFKGDRRKVTLTGEAYFEVAKDKNRPFMVSTSDQDIEVLGTHFNVKSYPDESDAKTTLLEGRVKVIPREGSFKILNPGQQAVWSKNKLRLLTVDSESEVAWKNGDFVFTGQGIRDVMRTISRWYDVEVDYQTDPGDMNLEGAVSRSKKLSVILKVLESSSDVRFRVNNNKIIVTK